MALKMVVDVYGFGLSFGESRDQFEDGFKRKYCLFCSQNFRKENIHFLFITLVIRL